MKIHVEITQEEILFALKEYVKSVLGVDLDDGEFNLLIETKSKQNYRSEWEEAAFRASINGAKS
jgi:hypothetical protein